MNQNNKTIVDIKKLSEYLDCGTSTIRKLIHNNKIPFFRISSKYAFDLNIINKWIISNHNNIEIENCDNDID